MRIGIAGIAHPSWGGVYQYSLSIVQTIDSLAPAEFEMHEIVLFVQPKHARYVPSLQGAFWEKESLYPPPAPGQRLLDGVRNRVGENPLRLALRRLRSEVKKPRVVSISNPYAIQYRPNLALWFVRHRVDWLLLTHPTVLGFEAGIPFVMPVHDLQHRLQPEFSEVSAEGEWERREYLYRNAARHAKFLLVDSEVGKEDLLNFYSEYGITEDRVKVLPFLPATTNPDGQVPQNAILRVKQKHELPDEFYFYPAQFWPHKNHLRIVESLGLIKQQHEVEMHLVLCGSHSGDLRSQTFEEVLMRARALGVDHQVHYLGYVPDEDMPSLYSEAKGLIMPTFFGPTNIPILEAWSYGCPVITSDIRGIREQVGDAGLLVNPRSEEDIAGAMFLLWNNSMLRNSLATLGLERLSSYTPDDFRRKLVTIIRDTNSLLAHTAS